jgi:hypothetical protein
MELLSDSVKISGVFDDGTGRLFPYELPCMLVPACAVCAAPACVYCEICGSPVCGSCMPCTCLKNAPRTIIESCENGDSGSTQELTLTIMPSLYEQVRGEEDRIPLEDGILVKTYVALGECYIEDEVISRYFATSLDSLSEICM